MKLNEDNEKELEDLVAKAEKVSIDSIPIPGAEDKYAYMREWILSLMEDEAIMLHAPNRKVADRLRNRWAQVAKDNQPHASKMKQNDGSYFVYLWLGGTITDVLYRTRKQNVEMRAIADKIVRETISKYRDKRT